MDNRVYQAFLDALEKTAGWQAQARNHVKSFMKIMEETRTIPEVKKNISKYKKHIEGIGKIIGKEGSKAEKWMDKNYKGLFAKMEDSKRYKQTQKMFQKVITTNINPKKNRYKKK